MGKIFKNIILMLLLFAVIIMMIGILFYDYLQTRVEVSKPNKYKEDNKVTTTLATIKKEEKEVFNNKEIGSTPGAVLQAYSLDAYDLAVYEQAGMYDSGKSNPFADLPELTPEGGSSTTGNTGNSGNSSTGNTNTTNKGNTNTNTNGNNINTNTLTEVKDNTILNSGNSK